MHTFPSSSCTPLLCPLPTIEMFDCHDPNMKGLPIFFGIWGVFTTNSWRGICRICRALILKSYRREHCSKYFANSDGICDICRALISKIHWREICGKYFANFTNFGGICGTYRGLISRSDRRESYGKYILKFRRDLWHFWGSDFIEIWTWNLWQILRKCRKIQRDLRDLWGSDVKEL